MLFPFIFSLIESVADGKWIFESIRADDDISLGIVRQDYFLTGEGQGADIRNHSVGGVGPRLFYAIKSAWAGLRLICRRNSSVVGIIARRKIVYGELVI